MAVQEEEVARIWADVIGVDVSEIDTDETFFDLGGNSLLLIKLVDELNAALGIETDIVMLLEFATIEEFVSHCNSELDGAESA
ncbi:acyl carrier protein [Actinophytocola gossypii]|uniref:Acyl carrier protein n=1 Tax=Actinophytocola gossypii TaxID=2812003 RepID=A0ABT2JKN0_9PSEU|nr:acyl carrier protein [Actinophytocola gossypii]MCT2588281.1 acyl carrier protein [Actinophytocola gossypii]